MISHEELWQRFVATRDPALREQLTLQYAPLVKYVINSMSMMVPVLATMEDMIGYGTIGLIHAVDRYAPDRGVTFETYAMSRIRGAIIDAIRSMNPFSRSDTSRIRAVEDAVAGLTQELARYPTEEEIAARMGVEREDVERTLQTGSLSFVSLDSPLGGELGSEGSGLKDLLEDSSALEPSEEAERQELRKMLIEGINNLPERSKQVISLYYVDELTPMEIADVLGVSRSRVYQLHTQAILSLRSWLRARINGTLPRKAAAAERSAPVGPPKVAKPTAGAATPSANGAARPAGNGAVVVGGTQAAGAKPAAIPPVMTTGRMVGAHR